MVTSSLLAVFAVLTGPGILRAEDKNPSDTPAGETAAQVSPSYQVKVLSTGIVDLGNPVLLGVYGAFADELTKSGLDSDPESVRKNLQLYLNGVAMEGLPAVILPPEATIGLKIDDPKPTYVLRFLLDRDSNNEPNRKAWDSLLSRLQFGPERLQAGVGLNGKVPHLSVAQDLHFQVRDHALIYTVIIVGVIILVIGMLAVVCSGMVREAGPGTPYSLGKTQMAFWGLVIAISFLAVWIVGHKPERIPSEALVLIGISGVTAFGSAFINVKARRSQQQPRSDIPPPTQISPQPQSSELPQSTEPGRFDRFVDTLAQWLDDIISDGKGVAFHRVQLVFWSVTLGVAFAVAIAKTCSMPDFEGTLLALMAISSGLYLAFKVQETPKSPRSPQKAPV